MTLGGKVVAAFVRVEPDGFRTDGALAKWLRRGLDFVATLPPKKRRKAASA